MIRSRIVVTAALSIAWMLAWAGPAISQRSQRRTVGEEAKKVVLVEAFVSQG